MRRVLLLVVFGALLCCGAKAVAPPSVYRQLTAEEQQGARAADHAVRRRDVPAFNGIGPKLLPATHVPVGHGRQNGRCCQSVLRPQHS
jgi:hypothetical protein